MLGICSKSADRFCHDPTSLRVGNDCHWDTGPLEEARLGRLRRGYCDEGDEFGVVWGSGNVFRDFDDSHADLKQGKAILAAQIITVMDGRKLTVRKAAAKTGFAAADFSRMRNADLGRFTLDRLFKMLAALDRDIKVTVHVASWRAGQEPASTPTG